MTMFRVLIITEDGRRFSVYYETLEDARAEFERVKDMHRDVELSQIIDRVSKD